jgi:4-hydroxy-tetrahydrodipicolinate reductase
MTEPLRHGVQRYRVAQWATGNIGARTMRAVLEHPNLTLAGGGTSIRRPKRAWILVS